MYLICYYPQQYVFIYTASNIWGSVYEYNLFLLVINVLY